jgi:SAM-dependent methyltransferase
MEPNPESILRIATGTWATAILGAAVDRDVFTLIEGGENTRDAVARAAGITPRGAQAVLDGLVALGLATVEGVTYSNAPDASMFLVRASPAYIGDWVSYHAAEMAEWSRYQEVLRTNEPVFVEASSATDLDALAMSLAPLSVPTVQRAGERLGVAGAGPVSILDVGGGSGVFSAIWLSMNPEATSTQIDMPAVNAAARRFVEGFGVADRFRTIDGDAADYDWGAGEHDLGVFSHVAHALTPDENRGAFAKFRRALRPGGTLVVADFVLADDRSGPPWGLMFHSTMVLRTAGGGPWQESEYREWLSAAGFREIEVDTSVPPVGIVYAR